MATRTITTKLAIDGETEFKKAMSEVNSALRTTNSEIQLAEAKFKGQANSVEALTEKDRLLRREIEQQQEKVKALAQAVVDASEAYGDADKRTDGYRQSLNRAQKELIEMNRELEDTEKYLKEAQDSSDGFAKSIDGFGKTMDQSEMSLGDLVDGFKNLKGVVAGGAIVGGIKQVTDAMFELEESTREYRQIMGTLEVSSQAAGYSAEQTAQVYNRLHDVLGDTQTAATAAANLQAIGLSQEDLMEMTNLAIGAWAKYGDSIPIDSMAEAITLGAQQSEVSSGLADALEWAGVNTEEFKAKLEEANSTQERAKLIMDTLSEQGLGKLAENWREVNEDIVAVNESQRKLEEQWARAGEMVAPLVSALKNGAGVALESLLDGFDALIAKTQEWGRNAPTIGEMIGWQDPKKVDGSHAGGLSYVPYDGYLAELHRGEAVLTAAENQARMSLSAPLQNPQGALTAKDMQSIMAASVNALNEGKQAGPTRADIRLVAGNGTELARWLLPDLRAVMHSDPEVTDD